MLVFYRTKTFWIAVCSWLVLMGGHYAAVVPAPYGLVLGNAVALVYGAMRCLQKRQAGIPWKGILFTSEFAITSATVLMNFLDSLAAIPSMPPKALAGISAAVVALSSLLHTLSGGKTTLPSVSAIMHKLADDNLAGTVADSANQKDNTKPGVPTKIDNAEPTERTIAGPVAIEWYEYIVSTDNPADVSRAVCLDPSWNSDEVLSFLVKRGFKLNPSQCTVRVLQNDERGMRVFQVIDGEDKTLTFVFQKHLGHWNTK
jgi:hypothetical protein